MAAWVDLAWQLTRNDFRRAQTWRNRVVLVFACAFAGAWAALAPQAKFDLGERIHLGFRAATILCVLTGFVFASFSPARVTTEFHSRQLTFAIAASNFLRALAASIAVIPLIVLPFGIQIVGPSEFLISALLGLFFLASAAALSAFNLQLLALPFFAAFWIPNWSAPWTRLLLEFSFLLLFAIHVFAKCRICSIASKLNLRNVAAEILTSASIDEICRHARKRIPFRRFVIIPAALNVAALVVLQLPLPMGAPERSVLRVLLLTGILSLLWDARALVWKGLWLGVSGAKLQPTLLGILATPWILAWMLYALHTGNMGDNEAAGVFILWGAAGACISYFAGSSAKAALQNNLRARLVENL